MSGVRADVPIAITVGDIHMSHAPPVSRGDADWYGVMRGYWEQVKAIQASYEDPTGRCLRPPILCSGDLFHRWNAPPELIAFALETVPFMYAIPGQHDLPNHVYEARGRSAYGCLVAAQKIADVRPGERVALENFSLFGFPWGAEVSPTTHADIDGQFNVALIHAYCWREGHEYPGVGRDSHVLAWREKLAGFRVAVFGDNHRGFLDRNDEITILNGGTFIRRNSDEADYAPKVGLIWADGSVTRKALDTFGDVMLARKDAVRKAVTSAEGLNEFLEVLESSRGETADFVAALREFMEVNRTSPPVRERVMRAAES